MLCFGLILLQLAAWKAQWKTNQLEIDRLRADQRKALANHDEERRHKERIDLRRTQATVEPTESSGWCSALACGYCTASLRVQPTASHAVPINCAEDSL
jgi:hypothetical protein